MPVTIIFIRDMVRDQGNILRTPRPRLRVPALLLAVLLAGACAGGGGEDTAAIPPTDGAPAPAAPATPVEGDSAVVPPADEARPEPVAGASWTASAKRSDAAITGAAVLRAMRTARHDGFDRIVLEFEGDAVPGHRISFIEPPAQQCGSGDPVTVAGAAVLMIAVEPAYAHTEAGEPTVRERSRTPGLPALVGLKLICDFEAVVELVAGLSSRTQYRVFTLGAPARIVIDVMHPASS
jgi:hypothetical protein